ncbi:MAG: hypothetical protein K6B41_05720 [Butyrivibrio sp.]|nr:hypothetical protein [Butyrivibrio sp.]
MNNQVIDVEIQDEQVIERFDPERTTTNVIIDELPNSYDKEIKQMRNKMYVFLTIAMLFSIFLFLGTAIFRPLEYSMLKNKYENEYGIALNLPEDEAIEDIQDGVEYTGSAIGEYGDGQVKVQIEGTEIVLPCKMSEIKSVLEDKGYTLSRVSDNTTMQPEALNFLTFSNFDKDIDVYVDMVNVSDSEVYYEDALVYEIETYNPDMDLVTEFGINAGMTEAEVLELLKNKDITYNTYESTLGTSYNIYPGGELYDGSQVAIAFNDDGLIYVIAEYYYYDLLD